MSICVSPRPEARPQRTSIRRYVAAIAALVLPVVATREIAAQPPSIAPPTLGFVLIGNTTGTVDIDSAGLRAVFRGERSQWPTSKPVTVILPSARAEFAEPLARLMFRSSPSGMQRYWLALVFQGRAAPPVFLDSSEEIVAFVRRTPGAVAMVPVGTAELATRELVIRVR